MIYLDLENYFFSLIKNGKSDDMQVLFVFFKLFIIMCSYRFNKTKYLTKIYSKKCST